MDKGTMVEVEKIFNYMQTNADEYRDMVIHDQDRWYESTEYYNKYIGYIQSADKFSQDLMNQLNYQCLVNTISFKNPVYQNVKKTFSLDLGYQVPDVYLEYLCSSYYQIFSKYNVTEGTDVEITIKPIEYFKATENMIKWGPSYNLEIEIVDKLKKDKTKIK